MLVAGLMRVPNKNNENSIKLETICYSDCKWSTCGPPAATENILTVCF